ncbi:hypothetical protein [Lacrimispora sp. 210928-DFI.3.58]|uniref:hypothetical protein n=1 Tax=Lacrimispora sp. 210928-DFI.3.58 TaxID=2883214 RepID=UPI0015B49DFA|nr:hypothetical protein [Lacrimispora sp. 210928-DFI.3.58]MCB7318600.1 hypothetical protein [Lacrimispora sp. 210928-DFI.3.58]
MAIQIDRRSSNIEYDANGIAVSELLPGSYDGGIRNYRYNLKAGSEYSPKLYGDKTVILFFGKGRGYVTDEKDAYHVEELSFYAPEFDKTPYTVHAIDDMEFVLSIVDMNEWDWQVYNASHARLPFFRTISKCSIYDQDCKGPGTSSWNVLQGRQLGRIMIGAVRAVGSGTREKGHAAVHQWNYCVGNSDFNLTVGDETISTKAGDWSFVPAGEDHALVSDEGKEAYYVWYEHYAKEKDFIVKPAPKHK